MKTPDNILTVVGSIVFLAVVTTLVLPGRQTPSVIAEFFKGFARAIRAAMGG